VRSAVQEQGATVERIVNNSGAIVAITREVTERAGKIHEESLTIQNDIEKLFTITKDVKKFAVDISSDTVEATEQMGHSLDMVKLNLVSINEIKDEASAFKVSQQHAAATQNSMKGTIALCVADMVKNSGDPEKWDEVLRRSGLPRNLKVTAIADVDDAIINTILKNVGEVLNLSMDQVIDAFGDYWVNSYGPKVYKAYYRGINSAKEFIMGMDKIHEQVTRIMPNAHPPRFDFEEIDEHTLKVHYKSHRKMINLYISLAKGVGKFFKTPLTIKKLSEEWVEITFR
jgi:hypothetical protein